jgi:transcription elongation factor Elf1
MRRYSPARTGEEKGSRDMHLHHYRAKLSRAFTAPTRCPHCGDLMVAPISSEFVESGEIRHHWECDSCGEPSSTSIPGAFH